jgi:hypothetical protein
VFLALISLIPTIALIAYSFLALDFLLTISSFWWILGPIIFFLVFVAIVYFVLAPNNLFFTFVHEGTAKWVVRSKKFSRCLMEWEGYAFDSSKEDSDKWNVIPGKLPWYHRLYRGLFGGLRFYGIWPLWDIHIYKFKWTGVTESGEEVTREEWLDYILLTDDIYLARTHRAEDKDLLPLDVQLYLTIRILNPYKAKFRIQDWLETTINRMQPLIRQHISQSDYEDLSRNLQATEEELLKKLEDGGLIQEFQIRYGVGVRKIEIRQIEPPEALRKDTLKEYVAEQNRKAKVKEAEGEAEAIKLVAAAKAEEIEKTFGAVESFGEQGFLLEIAKMAKEGNVPASVITHYLAGRFSKVLEDRETMTSEELRSFIKKLIEEFTQLEEAVEKL